MRRLISLLLLLFFLPSLGLAEAPGAEYFEAPKQIVVTFTGDCTLGNTPLQREVDQVEGKRCFESYVEEFGLEYPFAMVRDIFLNDDLTIINLESTFYDYEANKAQKTYNFRSPTSYADMLPMAGIDAVSMGNNHIEDYGAPGFRSTVDALESRNIQWFGSNEYGNKTYIYEKDGVKIGFVAIYISWWWVKGTGELMKQTVADLKDQGCSLVVACLHGGVEYDLRHDTNQERIADAFIRYGADIVIGHHPHVLQGIRLQKDTGVTTLWSLGNFCFGGNPKFNRPEARYACIAQFTFSFDEDGTYLGHQINLIPAFTSGSAEYNDYQPHLAEGEDAEKILAAIQLDTPWKMLTLNPYVPGVGALQDFVPAP